MRNFEDIDPVLFLLCKNIKKTLMKIGVSFLHGA